MNKYLKYYYIDSFFVLLIILLIYFFGYDQVNLYYMFASGFVYPLVTVFVLISLISFVLNVLFHITKRKFMEDNLLFPKYYLLFLILVVILGFIYNQIALFKGLHIMYYLSFIVFGYTLLSVYTTLSFKKENKKNK